MSNQDDFSICIYLYNVLHSKSTSKSEVSSRNKQKVYITSARNVYNILYKFNED